MSKGTPRPDSRQACSPSASVRRFSSCRIPAGEAGGSFVGGEQVGLQRGAGDRVSGPVAGDGRDGVAGVDLREQVAVAVEEAAVHAGGAGDLGDADLGALGAGVFEGGGDPLASAGGVGLPTFPHCRGALVGLVSGRGRTGHAVASGRSSGVVARVVGIPRDTAR